MRKTGNYRINTESFIGFKVGKLTVTKFLHTTDRKSGAGKHYHYECICDCGGFTRATKQNLVSSKKRGINCACKQCLSKTISDKNKNKPPKWKDEIDKKVALIKSEYTTRAVKKQIEMGLTHEDFKTLCSTNCYYCGISAKEFRVTDDKPKKGLMRLNFNGLDRVNSKKGYTLDNVVPCCEDCNKAKRNLEQNDFLNLIKQIYENRIANNHI